ncbi:MAG: hypothetical protein PHT37_06235 [Candidatus Cloacimonetes bacterium]|jgi:hypothetical protein|nr:hypothetical protein [Candidatus Cloacimonadota bacterium]MDD4277467.1 hypothetical protein [Candidatus Cloacimonadota bacterium]
MRKALLALVLCMLLGGAFALSSYGTSAPVANDTVDPSLSILCPNSGEAWNLQNTQSYGAIARISASNSSYQWR